MDTIMSMGPQTDRSDIIISIHPEPVEQIIAGTKDHEFRNYKIPFTVSRIWIYVTHPISELQYMATIGPVKEPGEIPSDTGVGNSAFNAGTKSKFAHELLQVYELNNPVSLHLMKEHGWVKGPPQKYVYVPPAVVGQLLGNLRCALFANEEESSAPESILPHDLPAIRSGSKVSVSQELEDQLKSDISYATQGLSDAPAGVISSSLKPELEPSGGSDDLSTALSVHVPGPSPQPAEYIGSPGSSTASEPSSPEVTPQKSSSSVLLMRPMLSPGGPTFPDSMEDDEDDDSGLVVYGEMPVVGPSSSLDLGPDSLLYDQGVRMPPEILDSEDDEDDSISD
jgi:predicted transcriptional regulator